MGLEKYWQKRDFKNTPEPHGMLAEAGDRLNFVIQRHAARRLHYDFRLELDGSLKSWAIPKGPSLDPSQKRLAVHVEDHPLDYAGFEGEIPPGQYGAGHVIIWDRGIWIPENDPEQGLREGNLKFRLEGSKLAGRWALIRLRKASQRKAEEKENWLLIKERDEHARTGADAEITELAPDSVVSTKQHHSKPKAHADTAHLALARKIAMPDMMQAQLATLTSTPPSGAGWLSEFKFDGYRVLCRIDGDNIILYSRSGLDWTHQWQPIADALKQLPVQQAWLDGEVVGLDDQGRISFQVLQNRTHGRVGALACYLFDLMYLDGFDLRALPLRQRKQLLRERMAGLDRSGSILLSEHIEGHASEVFQQACKHGMEGIIAKRIDAPYTGSRNTDWLKIKCVMQQEFVIAGYTDPAGKRSAFGALLLGVYDQQQRLQYAGRVGTGFDDASLRKISSAFPRLSSRMPAFVNPPVGSAARGVHWLKPALVAQVRFAQWTDSGLVRHASFLGLRDDKPPGDVRRETATEDVDSEVSATVDAKVGAKVSAPAGANLKITQSEATQIADVRLSNPDRLLWQAPPITKLELAQYYEEIAAWILPHLQQRPLTLLRCPSGGHKACFYQKHANESTASEVERIAINDQTYMTANSLTSLIAMAQMGVLELHTWGARTPQLHMPDRLIFDLDPAPDVAWKAVIEAAQLTRALLDELGLASFVKTTGGKGLHVVVPIKPQRRWEEIKPFTKAVAQHLERQLPGRFTANMAKKKRVGKIFVDYLRNGWEATAIAAYSTRATPGAPVSVPLDWDELSVDLHSDHFKLNNVRERLSGLRQDPWADYARCQQEISDDMLEALGL